MAHSLLHTLNISRQDMQNRMQDLDSISNNLANVNTGGFKGSRMNFQELLSSQQVEGTTLNSSQVNTTQGVLRPTENPYDWAIQGDGFFAVKLADGKIGYTRDGAFQLDSKKQLVNSSGYLLDWNGQIPADTQDISLGTNGSVTAILADGSKQAAGNVELARFANPTALVNAGNNVWIPGEASGIAQMGTPGVDGCGTVQAHMLESSNINLADEMTHIIRVQRGFQMTSRVFQQTDTMISEAIHMRKA